MLRRTVSSLPVYLGVRLALGQPLRVSAGGWLLSPTLKEPLVVQYSRSEGLHSTKRPRFCSGSGRLLSNIVPVGM